jgi:lysophospholipase L1-like esterase
LKKTVLDDNMRADINVKELIKLKKIFSVFLSGIFCFTGLSWAAIPVSANDKPVIIAFGDSLTAEGVYIKNLNNQFGINIINAGVGGNNTVEGKARFQKDVLSKNPDTVIICFGMNDSAKDMAKYVEIEAFKNNLRYFIKTLKDRGVNVILANSTYIEESEYYTRHNKTVFEPYGGAAAFVDLYCQAVREVAAEQKVPLADVRKACDAYTDRTKITTDGVHCTQLGYSLYSKLIGEKLVDIYRGDIDFDGTIDSLDYLLLKKYILGNADIPSQHRVFADVDKDNTIDSLDYLLIKRHILGNYNIQEGK